MVPSKIISNVKLMYSALLLFLLTLSASTQTNNYLVSFICDQGQIYTASTEGDGNFTGWTQIDILQSNARGITIGNFDSDAYLDIIAGYVSGNSAYLYKLPGNSSGGFDDKVLFATFSGNLRSWVMDMASGDFNEDGIDDFVVNTNSNLSMLYLSDGSGLFTPHINYWHGSYGRGMDAGDFNNDGHIDLVRAESSGGIVSIYLGDGAGNFTRLGDVGDAGSDPYGVTTADFDNDGKLDVLANAGGNGDLTFWKGNGDGTFQPGVKPTGGDVNNHGSIDAFDFNSDGNVDIIISNYTGRRAYFAPGLGDGNFGAFVELGVTANNVLACAAFPYANPGSPVARINPFEQTIMAGDIAPLDGSLSSIPSGSIVSWNWVFGDGEQASGAIQDHTYAHKGDYWPLLKVTGSNNYFDQTRAHVTVIGGPPVANAGGPYTFTEEQAQNGFWTGIVDGSASTNDGGEGASYVWNFMPGIGLYDDFSGGAIDDTKWRYLNCIQENGVLKVGTINAGGWGTSYFESKDDFQRREALTFYTKYKATASENIMFGFKNNSDNHHYNQLYHAFYPAGTGLYIYESGSSRGRFKTISYGTWYDLKIELKEIGADYWFKPASSNNWERIYSSSHQSGNDLKIGVSGYRLGRNEFDYFYLGNRDEGKQVSHTFRGAGTYPVTLTVYDFLGQSSTANTTVTTQGDNAPVAATGGPYMFDESTASQGKWVASLNATGSSDDHGIAEYTWDFGDGTTGTGSTSTHTYNTKGPHIITLVVKDHANLTDSDQGVVSFSSSNPPTAAFTGPATIDEGAANQNKWTANFNASSSSDDFGIWKYEWQFGDGGTGTGVNASHGYNATGTYDVTLTVFDHAGQSTQLTKQIEVLANNPPVAKITAPTTVDESSAEHQKWTVEFSASSSTDDFGVWKYQWDFGDGTSATAENSTHQYSAVGNYTVTLTVTDHANQTHSTTHEIAVVTNDPPEADITANPTTVEGTQMVSFSGAGSTDDYGISSYEWNLGTSSYDLSGTEINTSEWTTKGNVQQNDAIIIIGATSWGNNNIYTNENFARPSELQATIKTNTGSQNMMVGFKNTSGNGHYNQFLYAIYFNNNSYLYIYENGANRGWHSTYTPGLTYDIRIQLKESAGAIYQYREKGATEWINLYTSNYSAEQDFKVGMDVYRNTFEIEALTVLKIMKGVEISASFNTTTDVLLTVTDHGGQQDQTTQTIEVISAELPVAQISGPDSYPVNLEAQFSGSESSDDYDIKTYRWDFGDGSPLEYGENVVHRYTSEGDYAVQLTVFDYANQSNTATHQISITLEGIVRCIPWQIVGDKELPHETWTDKEITLKAVANTAALPLEYTWDFGDGSPTMSGTVTTLNEAYKIETKHTYTGQVGTPYTAIVSIVDANGSEGSDSYPIIIREKTLATETNVAIDEGLWYLHKQQVRTESNGVLLGYWQGYSSYKMNVSGSAVQSFEINGHLHTGDQLKDPYVETVQRGIDYICNSIKYANINNQTHGNPDMNGNGIGVTIKESQHIYQLGTIMDALIASNAPDYIARIGGVNIVGRSLHDIVQDMSDMYSWGQVDAGGARGGWRYSWNSGSDNSAAQWAAIGLIPAERIWHLTVSQFVKDENNIWLNYSFNGYGFGYTGKGHSFQTTPSGMVQLAFCGATTSDSRWVATENQMAKQWSSFMSNYTLYGFFAFAKAMRTARPEPVITLSYSGLDWFNDDVNGMCRNLINRQRADGSWYANTSIRNENMNTAWTIIILSPTLFEKPPVASVTAAPNPAAIGQNVTLNGSSSYHLDPFSSIETYEWDIDASDGIDWNNPDATGPVITHSYGELGDYVVTLRVGDDSDPAVYDVATVTINVTIPPHPPTAVPGGPYLGVVGEPVQFDGSGSFDVNESLGDIITAWGWETDFENPRDFDDAIGEKASYTYNQEGTFDLGLRVTDNTEVVFPQSGEPNLTHDAFTKVTIEGHCITDLEARPKATKCQLVWTHDGSAEYQIYRSEIGPNIGFELIGTTSSTYSTFIDYNVVLKEDYWYRVESEDNCGSFAVHVNSQGRVRNYPPVISSSPVEQAQEGVVYTYDVEATDPEGLALTYYLDEAPDGMSIDATTGEISWTPQYAQVGVNNVLVRVSDPRRASATQFYRVTVTARPNTPPVPEIDAVSTAYTGETIEFDASGSIDPEGDLPLSYTWSFGDGSTAEGTTVNYSYNAAASYVVTVFVTDSRGATGRKEHNIVINEPNYPPVANPGGPYSGEVGKEITFDGSGSTDPNGDDLTYTWNLGDDSPEKTGPVVTHTFSAEGTYLATLSVDDGRGGIGSAEFTVTISPANNSPTAIIIGSAQFGNVGDEFEFNATQSTDPDGDPLLFSWTFGDNMATTGEAVTHVYNTPGLYVVTLTANDQRGGTDTAQYGVHINAPPQFVSTPITSTLEDEQYTYNATATDADGHVLTYSLISKPLGMAIDQATGTVTWTPENSAVGTHSIRIQADDSNGRTALQDYTLEVVNTNDRPVITSTPGESVDEGNTYTYNVIASDVDVGDVLSYSLGQSTVGMSINSTTGEITWETDHEDIGTYGVSVRVEDQAGGFAIQDFDLTVNELPWPPEFISTPDLTANEDEEYTYTAEATDQNAADNLTYALISGPEGIAINETSGYLTWIPTNGQVGSNEITLQVSDGSLTDEQTFTIEVTNTNDAPTITSTAPIQAQVEVEYTYNVEAEDVDVGDVLTYSLTQGSGNATINSLTGVLSWTPAAAEEGEQQLGVRVEDNNGVFDEQTFTVTVQLQPEPPEFTSTPVVTALEDETYTYQASATDPNQDPLTFALVSGPEGMSVSEEGLVQFIPTNSQVGTHAIILSVTDGLHTVNQEYTLTVNNVNDDPVITSSPIIEVSEGASYQYTVEASDEDGDVLTYQLVTGPQGMTINGGTGEILWQDDGSRSDGETVEVEVEDGNGGVASQSWTIAIVEDNIPPTVTLTISANPVTPGNLVAITVQASDNVAVSTIVLTVAGVEVELDDNNQYFYTANTEGDISLHAQATDPLGNTGEATATLTVSTTVDDNPPSVSLSYSPVNPTVGEDVLFDVQVSDDMGIDQERIWLQVDGIYIPVVDGKASYKALKRGSISALATAYDLSGNYGADQKSLSVTIAGTDVSAPTAIITSPENDDEILTKVDVLGSATDDNFAYYTLSYTENIYNNGFVEYLRSTSPVENGTLGTFDATQLENGIYFLRLTVVDAYGNETYDQITVSVDGGMKVGNFSISFSDMKIPLPGIELEVLRTYDSRIKKKKDFGVGWTLDIKQSAKLSENVMPGKGWSVICTKSLFGVCLEWGINPSQSHFITVNLPGAPKQVFDVEAVTSYANPQGLVQGYLRFKARPGTYSTLQALDNVSYEFMFGGILYDFDLNEINPNRYRLTLSDGTSYVIDQNQGGIVQVGDKNGNRVDITPGGIVHSSGEQIQFNRDAMGRLTSIVDGDGRTVAYGYDGHGNLQKVTDPNSNITRFKYAQNHYLTDIIDPRGVRAVRNEYDDEGRLVRRISPEGDTLKLTHDLDNKEQAINDFEGNETRFTYDDRGNILTKRDPSGATWSYTYDAKDNLTQKTNPDASSTIATYDTRGNQLTYTDELGNTTTKTYSAQDNVLTSTDALGRVTTYEYDAKGNQTRMIGQGGVVLSEMTYNSAGKVLTETDALGNVTTFTYTSKGYLASKIDALGRTMSFTYDRRGKMLSQTDPLGNVTQYSYDANGNRILVTDALSGETTFSYNSFNKLAQMVDENGNATALEYDVFGRKQKEIKPDGSTTEYFYANENSVSKIINPNGNVTEMAYVHGRLVETKFADGSTRLVEYNSRGKKIAKIDGRGNRTEYVYDAIGRTTVVRDALGQETHYEFDAVGNRTAMVDALGRRTTYTYDAFNRLVQITFADGSHKNYTYDNAGRKISETDQAGSTTNYEYDSDGNLIRVIDAMGHITTYTYNGNNKLISQTDANGNTTQFEYDALNRKTKRTLPLGMFESKTYDPVGNVVSKTDFNGNTIQYSYDALNRLVTTNYSDGTSDNYAYTLTGKKQTVTDKRGVTAFQYDMLDRLIQRTDPEGGVISYTYDAAGNKTSVTVPSGVTEYVYDALNRKTEVVDHEDGITSYSYDAVGNRIEVIYPNATVTEYSYDPLNRLINLVNRKDDGTVISSYNYALDAIGNRISVNEHSGRTVEYSYDVMNKLIGERITDPGVGIKTTTYTYDPVGNRLSMVIAGVVTNYSYDSNDRLLAENGIISTYDLNGNLLSKQDGPATTQYTYDFNNKMISVVTPDGHTTEYLYNVNGDRVTSTTDGVETQYLVDECISCYGLSEVLEERDGSNALVVNYTHGDDLLSQTRVGVTSYYHYDGLGSTRALSIGDASVTDRYNYNAFGELLDKTGSTVNNYLFTGEQYDPNARFYYLRARYYDQATGRFTSIDPFEGNLSDPMSLHKYLYAHANPIMNIDPSGKFTLVSISVSMSIQSTLQSIQITYLKSMIKMALNAAQVIFCVIEPGYKLMEAGMVTMFTDADDAGWATYMAGHNMVRKGYAQLAKAIASGYADFASNLIPSVKLDIKFANNTIDNIYNAYQDVQDVKEKLDKLKGYLKTAEGIIDKLNDPSASNSCKAAFLASTLVNLIW